MNGADDNCPHCGLRRRPGWFRCPRCREILPELSATSKGLDDGLGLEDFMPEGTSRRTPSWTWVTVAAAVVVTGAIGMMSRSGSSAPASIARESGTNVRAPEVSGARGRPTNPDDALPHLAANAGLSGSAAYAKGDLEQARRDYEAAVTANPEDAAARNNLAQVLMRQNLPSIALFHLDEAVRIQPQKWAYRFNRARAYGETNRLPEAAAEYQVAAELFPEDYATYYNLGLTRMKLKQYAEAVRALEQAVKLAPGEPSFLISLGTAYVAAQQPDRAKATFEQFLQQAPADAEVPRVKDLLSALDASR